MPLQNRVTPFGELVATRERGGFTGNRGILHDPATRTLLGRRWTSKAWIVCVLAFQGRRRTVMGTRSWTELFFLDEATALAAGHRPCFFCRRTAARAFQSAWAAGNGIAPPRAPAMDETLHRERLEARRKRLHPLPGPLAALPAGTMLAAGEASYLVTGARLLQWSARGYREADVPPAELRLLTPPSTVRTLAAGYRPVLHASAFAPAGMRGA